MVIKIVKILRLPPPHENRKGAPSDILVSTQLIHLAITVRNLVPNFRSIEL